MNDEKTVNDLRAAIKPEHVLTDLEDLHVYSFELLFEKHRPEPNMVVKAISAEEVHEISDIAIRNGLTPVRRSAPVDFQTIRKPFLLIDDIPAPELTQISKEKVRSTSFLERIRGREHGSYRNLAIALKDTLLRKGPAKCRECKTCSGYCTVTPSFGGIETWSSKGRTLISRAINNSELPISKKSIDILYTCTGCGLCLAECFSGLELNQAFLETRHMIAEKGLAPQLFMEAARNITKTGDPAASSIQRRLSWMRSDPESSPRKAETLYWVGCMVATRTPRTAVAFQNILRHADVDFTVLAEREGCCGYVLLSTGLWKDARTAAEKVMRNIERTSASVIVTPCAGCYYTFKKLYPRLLNISLPCEVIHTSQFIQTLVREARVELKDLDLAVSYHDPCSLGRHSGVFDAPREVLRAVPSLNYLEMSLSRDRARCCGGGGGLWTFNHQVSMASAHQRLEDLQQLQVHTLVTACPLCQMNLGYTALRRSYAANVCDIAEVVEAALL